MRHLMLLLAFVGILNSPSVFAAQTFQGTVLSAVTGQSDHQSSSVDASSSLFGSFQCIWASLTGTINATVQAQVSADGGTTWDNLSGTSLSLSGASGHNTVVVSGVLTTPLVRLNYLHGSVAGGTVTCYLAPKE